jgi:hypothetical protein
MVCDVDCVYIINIEVANCMEHSSSWEANNGLACQEVP